MRKNLTQITAVVCLLLACQLPLEAQSLTASTNQADLNASQITFTFVKEAKKKSEAYTLGEKRLALPLLSNEYDLLMKNGAFYDPSDNHLYVNTNFDSKFKKVEILNKFASGLVYSGQLVQNPYSKFQTSIDPGTYLIILTNDAGDILVDEINVIQSPNLEPMEELASEELIDDLPISGR